VSYDGEELTQKQRDACALGLCPFCGASIRNYEPPAAGFFAPEAYATLEERGIDPATGHRSTCKRKDVKLC
jgi:hypothetical protein